VDEKCCDVARACGEDAGCLALRECFAACALGDLECEAACGATVDDALGALNGPMVMCRNTMCGSECVPQIDWTCLGAPDAAPQTEAGTLNLSLTIQDFQTGAPAAGVTVKVCAREDALCEAPQSEGETDANGEVALTAERGESGFRGYLEVTGGGRAASHTYFSEPLAESGDYPVLAISESTLGLFTGLLGVEQDPARAAVAARVTDCSGRLAPGIVLGASTADDASQVGYLKGALPDPAATETDRAGLGGIFNLPPGAATVTGTRADGALAVEVEVTLRAGFLSVLTEAPTADAPISC
jgi:5-hydroxyisourate hydrolase-like protein (transthyretin family)